MKNIETQTRRTVFRIFLITQVLVPLVNVVLYERRNGYPTWPIFCHVVLVVLGYLALLGAAVLPSCSHAVRARRGTRYLLPMAWGSLTVVLYFSYLLAWLGRQLGMNATPAMVAPYVRHPSWILGVLPIPLTLYWGILVVIPLALLTAYVVAAPAFGASLLRLLAWLRRGRRARPDATQRLALATALPVLLLVAGFDLYPWPYGRTPDALFGDPIFRAMNDDKVGLPMRNPGQAQWLVSGPVACQQGILPISDSGGAATEVAKRTYAVPAAFKKKNVILIVIDACRADHLGVMGYVRDTTPFLDSLRQSGGLHTVRAFYSTSCCTFGGVMSLLRAQNWFKMSPRAFALQDVLKRVGYRVHFVLGGDLSTFQGIKPFFGDSLDSFSDGLSPGRHFGINDDRGVLEACQNLAPSDGTPSFFYFHLMSVHPLGLRLPQNVRYWPAEVFPEREKYRNNYDNGVLQADGNIRELFSMLRQKGYLQNSLVVITGDHGDSMGERGVYGHTQNLYAEEVSPPLLIYDPDPVPYRNLDLARQIDVAPTILDRLGLPIPTSWDGHSLLRDEIPRFSYLSLANFYAVVDHSPARTLKYIYDDRRKTEEVYDDTTDPGEHQNIIQTTEAHELDELRSAVGAFSVYPRK